MGRQRPVRAKGSSRWPDLVAEPLTCLCAPTPPNVKFRGTADSCQRSWPTPGIGACRHSPTKSERPQSEWTGRSPGKPWSAAFGNRRHSSTKFERLQSVFSGRTKSVSPPSDDVGTSAQVRTVGGRDGCRSLGRTLEHLEEDELVACRIERFRALAPAHLPGCSSAKAMFASLDFHAPTFP